MAHPKIGRLRKSPHRKRCENSDKFQINSKYSNPRTKMNISMTSLTRTMMKNDISNDVSDDAKSNDSDTSNDDKYVMSNPLVLIICISKYDGCTKYDLVNLKSVKIDMLKMQNLWKGQFNYYVINNDMTNNEYFVDHDTLFGKIDEAKVLLRNKNLKFDGFIFIFSGHGYRDGIFTSIGEKIQLDRIEKQFSPLNIKSFKDCPKIFIIDACRSTQPALPMDERLKVEIKQDTEIKGIKNENTTRFYHPLSNMIEICGNTRGYSVSGSDKGGSLIGEIEKTFDKYITKKSDIFNKKTFQQLFNPIKKSLHTNQFGNKIIDFRDTWVGGVDVYISPKTS